MIDAAITLNKMSSSIKVELGCDTLSSASVAHKGSGVATQLVSGLIGENKAKQRLRTQLPDS